MMELRDRFRKTSQAEETDVTMLLKKPRKRRERERERRENGKDEDKGYTLSHTNKSGHTLNDQTEKAVQQLKLLEDSLS